MAAASWLPPGLGHNGEHGTGIQAPLHHYGLADVEISKEQPEVNSPVELCYFVIVVAPQPHLRRWLAVLPRY